MPGDMKEFPASSESDVLVEVPKENKFDFKKTDAIPDGNGKSKVQISKCTKVNIYITLLTD